MNTLCWSLFFVAQTHSLVTCLQENVYSGDGQRRGHSMRQTTASIQHLMELVETLEKRLRRLEQLESKVDEQNEVIQKLQLFCRGQGEKTQEPFELVSVEDKKRSKQPQFRDLEKRSDDSASWEPVVAQVTQRLNHAEADIQVLKNSAVAQEQAKVCAVLSFLCLNSSTSSSCSISWSYDGTVYVRWGHSACPSSAELVYSGYVGGSWYADKGAATNYLCLPPDPIFDGHSVPRYGHANVFGAEYQTCDEPECDLTPSCAVCRTPRESSLMLPARNTCYPGWTVEYSGYLMTNDPFHAAGTEYICVDSSRGSILSSKADENGALLLYTTYICGSLPCPPYANATVVLCAVCSK